MWKRMGKFKKFNKEKEIYGKWILWILKGEFIVSIISFLFYYSYIAFFFLQGLVVFLCKKEKERHEKKVKEQAKREFIEGLESLIADLQAGYSLENAFLMAKIELERVYSKDSMITNAFGFVVKELELKAPIETVLVEMSKRLCIKEVTQFSQMVSLGKKTGGNLIEIMEKTVEHIRESQEVEQEISTLVAGKRMEQNVMCVLPFFIVGYVGITNKGYYEPLYHNLFGVLFMTGILGIIFLSYVIGNYLIRIEV